MAFAAPFTFVGFCIDSAGTKSGKQKCLQNLFSPRCDLFLLKTVGKFIKKLPFFKFWPLEFFLLDVNWWPFPLRGTYREPTSAPKWHAARGVWWLRSTSWDFFFHKSGIWHHSKQRSFHRQILLQNGRKMSLVTEIDENIWYVFICVYILVRFRMIYCIFVAFMFWDTISVKRVDWDMLCFCGEMVMIAKAKATNFQDILQLAPCFFQGVSQKNPFQSSIPFTLVFFQSHSKDSIYLHYGHMLSSDFWRLC